MASQYVRLLTRNSSKVSNGVNAVHAATLYELGCIVTLKRNLKDMKTTPRPENLTPCLLFTICDTRIETLARPSFSLGAWIYVLPACVKILAVHDSVDSRTT